MADDEAGNPPPLVPDPDGPPSGGRGLPKSPGWYPDRTTPTDQSYWDGQSWTARRRWTAGQGWLVAGDAPPEALRDASPPAAGARVPANPSLSFAPSRSKATGFTFNLGVLLLLVSGIALMYGSVGTWVQISGNVGIVGLHLSLNGIDPGISSLISVNGWATFIGGILIVIFACFEMTSEELQLSILTTIIAAVTTILAIYDMFRIVQKISQVPSGSSASASVGWGLICVLSAAVLATLIALVRLLQR